MRTYFFSGILCVLLLWLQGCCSKKNQCEVEHISSFELVNFSRAAATDSVRLLIYARGTGFASALDTLDYKGQATSDTNVCVVHISPVDFTYDYGIYVVKTGREYKLGNFTAARKDCSKCFMRSSNRIGQVLSGYSVNNRPLPYEGTIRIFR